MAKRGSRTTSWGTIANVGVDLYQLKRLKNISSEVSNLRSSVMRETQNAVAAGTAVTQSAIAAGTAVTLSAVTTGTVATLSAISTVEDLLVGMMTNMRDMDRKLEILSEVSWNIANYFDRTEKKEQFIGSMRIILHNMGRELDGIEEYQETHTEYAVMTLEIIQDFINQHDVRVEHFAQVSTEEMKHAQAVLDRIESTHQILMNKLSDS
jgi:hypothetical protein